MRKSRISEFKVSPIKIMKRLGKMVEHTKNDPDKDHFKYCNTIYFKLIIIIELIF